MTSLLVEQPYDSLMEGRFDKNKDIIWGMVQHETEIYVRTVFGSPVNDIVGKAAWRLLIQGQGFPLSFPYYTGIWAVYYETYSTAHMICNIKHIKWDV